MNEYKLAHWTDYRVREILLAQHKPMFSFRLTNLMYKQLVRSGLLPAVVIL